MKKYFIIFVLLFSYGCNNNFQPEIANGGRAISISSDPNDDNNIIVASASGGLFTSKDGGKNWAPVTGDATFWFTDVKYYPPNSQIVIATATGAGIRPYNRWYGWIGNIITQ